jgi:hypothetical protein
MAGYPPNPSRRYLKVITRQLQIKLVKPSKTADAEEGTHEPLDLDKINEMVADQVFNTGVVVVGSIAAVKVVSTVCTIAINLTNPANWR